MLKFIIGFERNRALTRARCHAHLRDVHGPLVRSVPEFTRHVRRYVQNFALEDAPDPSCGPLVPDGAAELWFDDAESFVRAYAEPLYLDGIRPDEARFTDPGRYVASVTRESTAWDDDRAGAVKLIRFLPARPGVVEEAARLAWAESHPAVLAGDTDLRALATRYVMALPVPASENPFPQAQGFAVVETFWFAGPEQAGRFLRLERLRLDGAPHAALVDHARAIGLLAREHTVLA